MPQTTITEEFLVEIMNKATAHVHNSPCLVLAYNRPIVERTLIPLINLGVREIYIAFDGPRNLEIEAFQTLEINKIKRIDNQKNVTIKILQREKNLGIKIAIPNAIDWFFENVEAGVILEDDVLFDNNFIEYATTNLHMYRDDLRVENVSGNQFFPKLSHDLKRLSTYPLIWGWATWRDRWVQYRTFKGDCDRPRSIKKSVYGFWEIGFIRTQLKIVDSWAIPYARYQHYQNKITILPCQNLASNVGADIAATHTMGDEWYLNFAVQSNPCKCYQEGIEISNSTEEIDSMLEDEIYGIKWRHKFIKLQILGFRIRRLRGTKNSF